MQVQNCWTWALSAVPLGQNHRWRFSRGPQSKKKSGTEDVHLWSAEIITLMMLDVHSPRLNQEQDHDGYELITCPARTTPQLTLQQGTAVPQKKEPRTWRKVISFFLRRTSQSIDQFGLENFNCPHFQGHKNEILGDEADNRRFIMNHVRKFFTRLHTRIPQILKEQKYGRESDWCFKFLEKMFNNTPYGHILRHYWIQKEARYCFEMSWSHRSGPKKPKNRFCQKTQEPSPKIHPKDFGIQHSSPCCSLNAESRWVRSSDLINQLELNSIIKDIAAHLIDLLGPTFVGRHHPALLHARDFSCKRDWWRLMRLRICLSFAALSSKGSDIARVWTVILFPVATTVRQICEGGIEF